VTLIAAVGLDTYPVVFGDLLIPGPEQPGSVPDIPSMGEVTNAFPAGSDWSILGLNQKVVLLGDNCVIAWAGAAVFARTVISELRAIASKAPLSIATINTYLSQLDPTVKDQVSFVGWVRDGEVFHQFWYRADIAESAMFGRISAGGSSATDFVTLASQISGGSWNVPGRELTGLERAISSMLSATSLLLPTAARVANPPRQSHHRPADDRGGQACDFTIRHHCRCGAREQHFLAGNGSNIHVPCGLGALAEGHCRVQSNRLQRIKRAQKHQLFFGR
jgi:hypothetical protein